MAHEIIAGVISKHAFVSPTSLKFSGYIAYMSRSEAVRTESYASHNFAFDDMDYDGYNNYMSNPEKSSGLFSKDGNFLTKSQVSNLQKQFAVAQNNESNMWQVVFSFDNAWLEKHNVYKRNSNRLQEQVIMNATRNAMADLLKSEGLLNSAVWSGAIHYNTDNIHVHVAFVEPEPTRELMMYKGTLQRRGKLKYSNIERAKSRIANSISDRTLDFQKIDELVRQKIGSNEIAYQDLDEKRLTERYIKIFSLLPHDRRLWKYNNNAMSKIRPELDLFIEDFIQTYRQDEFSELNGLLDKQVAFNRETYGQKSRFDDYKTNKIHDLYSNIGNTILKEMSSEVSQGHATKLVEQGFSFKPQRLRSPNVNTINTSKIKHMFDKEYKSLREYLNLRAYEKLQRLVKENDEYEL